MRCSQEGRRSYTTHNNALDARLSVTTTATTTVTTVTTATTTTTTVTTSTPIPQRQRRLYFHAELG